MRLESLSTPVGPLNIDAPLATVNDRHHFRTVAGELVPTSARRRLHAALLGRWRDSCRDLRSARRATLFAGPPAAGKSTLMGASKTHLAEHRRIDADDFKALLLQSAVEDGSIASLVPLALRDNFGERFHPLELSALVHRESTILQERALSIGSGLLSTPITAAVLSGVDDDDAGAASGLMNTTKQVGSALGLAVLVTFSSTSPTVLDGYSRAFILIAAVMAVVAIVSLALPSRRPRRHAA